MATSVWEHFSIVPDPRVNRTKLHKLEDILTIVLSKSWASPYFSL